MQITYENSSSSGSNRDPEEDLEPIVSSPGEVKVNIKVADHDEHPEGADDDGHGDSFGDVMIYQVCFILCHAVCIPAI